MAKKYLVKLTEEEREQLTELIDKGQVVAYKIKHAKVLLKVDANGPDWSDTQAAEAFSCAPRTVFSLRQRFVEQGLEAALARKKQDRPSREPLLDPEQEARLIQLARSDPPPDTRVGPYACWPPSWSPWTWWNPSPHPPSCGCSKRRVTASANPSGDAIPTAG